MATKMGFEGQIYYGTAGSEASTLITNRRDVSFSIDPEKAETTTAGNGTAPPLTTERVVAIAESMEWTMLNKTTGVPLAALAALRAAAAAGTPIAFRMKDHSAGKGFNGDVTLAQKDGLPYKGEQTFVFTATPTNESGREPQPYV